MSKGLSLTKLCRKCGETNVDLFSPSIYRLCRKCNALVQKQYRATHKGQIKDRKYALKKRYGLSEELYHKLFDALKGRCAVCREQVVGNLHVDHDHKTGEVRGLLCNGCNRALGFINDNPVIALRMYWYLSLIDTLKNKEGVLDMQYLINMGIMLEELL